MWIAIILCAVPVFIIVILYNSLVSKKNQANNAFATIDVLLKKRYDLIPNIVSCVQNYMKHEKSVLTEITALRSQAVSGELSADDKIRLDKKISSMVSGIMVAVENYPELKASQNFLQLQAALNEIEEQISAARRAYNSAVTDLNNAIEMFPTNIVASMMNYKQRALFETAQAERENVNVSGLFDKQ